MNLHTLPFQQILVPIDFSRHGESTLEYAKSVALASGAKLYLVHIMELLGYAGEYNEVLMGTSKAREDCQKQLEEIAEYLPEEVRTEAVVKVGLPFEEIVKAAEELNCQLIIMGTHGRSGVAHAIMGSTAERVVQHSTKPVLIIPSRLSKH